MAFCALHADVQSTGTCARCGTFVCGRCSVTRSDGNSFCGPCEARMPEGDLASRLNRFWASLIDWWIFMTPAFIYLTVTDERDETTRLFVCLGTLMWVGALGYQLALARRGQSIGKQLRGIRVVRTDDSVASLWRILFLRNALPTLVAVVPRSSGLLALAEAAFIFRKDRRCLHDLLADTKVVNVGRKAR